MAALESAERAARALLEFPVLFVGAAALGVLKLPVEATRPLRITLDVYAVLALLTFAFTPVMLAGLYGLAAAALRGDGSAGDFWQGIGDGYLNLLLANVVYAAVQHLLMLVFTVVAVLVFVVLAGGIGVLAELTADPAAVEDVAAAAGVVSVAGIVVIAVVYLGIRFALAFFMQLYRPSAAVGGNGPVAAFAESARLVRANPESTLAFVLVRGFAMGLLVLPGLVAVVAFVVVEVSLLDQLQEAGPLVAAVLVVGFAVGIVELAFLATYRVTFYRSLVE